MIEIVARTVCPTCGGKKRFIHESDLGAFWARCDTCHGDGTVPRVLATFADAARGV